LEGCAACSYADLETVRDLSFLDQIQLKSREVELLKETVDSPTRLTRTELASRLNMSRTTIKKYLATLCGHNLIRFPDGEMGGVAATHEGYCFIERRGLADQK